MRKRGLCGQTVTVYHPVSGKKRVDRFVLRDVFCQIGSREVPDAAGAKGGAAMLLVVPAVTAGAVYSEGNVDGKAAESAGEDGQTAAAGGAQRELRYGADYRLASGDRVLLGEGPEVDWAAWPSFVPAEVDGLGAITYVLPLYLRGELHHVEAGAWWSSGGAGAGRLAR